MPKPVLLRIVGFANKAPCPMVGQFLKAYNLDAYDGQGEAEFTANPKLALHFLSVADAMMAIREASTVNPIREDGKPNRPLTCSHWEILEVDG